MIKFNASAATKQPNYKFATSRKAGLAMAIRMTYKIRFSLIGVGMVIFLIITPVLVLYARGFQFDWQTKQIVKTGALVVKTEPTKTKIFLNNKLQKELTPSNVRFLIPGDYDVRLEKDDYLSWTKRLGIKAQLVTWVAHNRDFTTLFLKTPKLIQTYTTKLSSASENLQEIQFTDLESNINTININSGENILRNGQAQTKATFDLNQLIWQNGSKVNDLFNEISTNFIDVFKQLQKAQKISSDGTYIVPIINNSLYTLNDENELLLIDKNVSTFTLADGEVWYIQNNLLKHCRLATKSSETISISVPPAASQQIIRGQNQIYLILDNVLYALNDTFEKIYDNVNLASWDSQSRQLLFANNNEVLIYNPDTKNSQLILRSEAEIQNPILNWTTGYVFYASLGAIHAIELDDRDHRNTYTIAGAGKNFLLNQNGKKLFVINDSEIKEYEIR